MIGPLASSFASTQSLQPAHHWWTRPPFLPRLWTLPMTSGFPLCPSKDCPLWLLSLDPQDQEKRRLSPQGWLFHTGFVFCRALAPSQLLTSLSPLTNAGTGSLGSVCPVQRIRGEATLSALQRKGALLTGSEFPIPGRMHSVSKQQRGLS